MKEEGVKQERVSWTRPVPIDRAPRRGPKLDEALDEDDPEREVVDRARELLAEGRVDPARAELELPKSEIAWRCGVTGHTYKRWIDGEQRLVYNLTGARAARVFISIVKKADERAGRS